MTDKNSSAYQVRDPASTIYILIANVTQKLEAEATEAVSNEAVVGAKQAFQQIPRLTLIQAHSPQMLTVTNKRYPASVLLRAPSQIGIMLVQVGYGAHTTKRSYTIRQGRVY